MHIGRQDWTFYIREDAHKASFWQEKLQGGQVCGECHIAMEAFVRWQCGNSRTGREEMEVGPTASPTFMPGGYALGEHWDATRTFEALLM